jgi:DNA-directed RNA polymerase specialized sigma24 family protein
MPPRPTLVEALHSREFEAMLPWLVASAERSLRRVGWAEGKDHIPAGAEAEELVSEAVEAALSGKRVWPDDLELHVFLAGVMRSQVEHRYAKDRRKRAHARDTNGAEERTAPSDDLHRRRELCAAVERELGEDVEMRALFGAMAGGALKPAERAELLGWTPAHEKTVHVRMNRRLSAAGLAIEPGDIGPQPLPGGRWIRATGDDA